MTSQKLYLPTIAGEDYTFIHPILIEMEDGSLEPDQDCLIAHLCTTPSFEEDLREELPFDIEFSPIGMEDALTAVIVSLPALGASMVQVDEDLFPLDEFGVEHAITRRLPYRSPEQGLEALIERISSLHGMSPDTALASLEKSQKP